MSATDWINPLTNEYGIKYPSYLKKVFIHIDEITRGTLALGNALLEPLGEGAVTFGDKVEPLLDERLVCFSRNPEGSIGTRFLPPPLWDRMGAAVTLIDLNEDELVLMQSDPRFSDHMVWLYVRPVITIEQIARARREVALVKLPDRTRRYIARLICAFNPTNKNFNLVHSPENCKRTNLKGEGNDDQLWDASELREVIKSYPSPGRATTSLNKLVAARAWRLAQANLDDGQYKVQVLDQDVKDLLKAIVRHKLTIEGALTPDQLADLVVRRVAIP